MPQYQDIARQLQARLDAGEFPPGSKLPSVRQLAARHGVNSLTALAAYRWLEQKQRVVARPRAGFFAALPARAAGQAPARALPSPATLVDVDSRMSQLVALSASDVAVQLHMAEAHHSLYPAAELARRLQQTLLRQPELIGAYLPAAQHERLCAQLRQMAAWVLLLPKALVVAAAGLALFGTLASSLGAALADGEHREAALLTFVVAASGVSIAGLGAPLWAMLAGGLLCRLLSPVKPAPEKAVEAAAR